MILALAAAGAIAGHDQEHVITGTCRPAGDAEAVYVHGSVTERLARTIAVWIGVLFGTDHRPAKARVDQIAILTADHAGVVLARHALAGSAVPGLAGILAEAGALPIHWLDGVLVVARADSVTGGTLAAKVDLSLRAGAVTIGIGFAAQILAERGIQLLAVLAAGLALIGVLLRLGCGARGSGSGRAGRHDHLTRGVHQGLGQLLQRRHVGLGLVETLEGPSFHKDAGPVALVHKTTLHGDAGRVALVISLHGIAIEGGVTLFRQGTLDLVTVIPGSAGVHLEMIIG